MMRAASKTMASSGRVEVGLVWEERGEWVGRVGEGWLRGE
jgi:hypothetical protein